MSESLGAGVSRTLSALQRQFAQVVWQKNRPPLDSELNLVAQIHDEQLAQLIRSSVHSGFFLDPTNAQADYVTDPDWSNLFVLGRQASGEEAPFLFANVNGWIVPVTGTGVADGDTSNRVTLNPPPASDARIDLVFLEVWSTLVAPNPSTDNKPSASTIWKFGNVEFGGTNITDDIQDPTLGFETTERVQVQYRLRVYGVGAGIGSSVALDVYPDGLDDPNITAQATAAAPVAGMIYTNMRDELGDTGLWRAGDGDATNALGTTDGYAYAIPVAAIFRRNSTGYESVIGGGNANQNGGVDRNPDASLLAVPREGAREFGTLTLTGALSKTAGVAAVANIPLTGMATSPFDAGIDLGSTFIRIGDEVIGPITTIDGVSVNVAAASRGRAGTVTTAHALGSTVTIFNPRPDGLWADQVNGLNILDLRKGISLGDWDYTRLLVHNVTKLVQGQLRTSYKQSSSSETEGVSVVEVSYLNSTGLVPPAVTAVDGPDGIRTVWSDGASLQPDVTCLLDLDRAAGTVLAFDAGVSWAVGADFNPSGFLTDPAGGLANGSTVFLYIGGSDGNQGARGTFRTAGTRAVRFVTPMEYWKTLVPDATTGKQAPVSVRFLDVRGMDPAGPEEAATPGPMTPTAETNFERPYIVMGGLLNSVSQVAGATVADFAGGYRVVLPGLNFDTAGSWWNGTDVESLSTDGITNTVLRGQRTLYDMLTRGGTDRSGLSSEVYVVLYGDTTDLGNNGAYQVIGAGTVGYTDETAGVSGGIIVRPLSVDFAWATGTGTGLSAQLRSQYTNAEDDTGGFAGGRSALAIVFTDIEGAATDITSPWAGLVTSPEVGKAVVNTTLQYHPGRASTPRVPDGVWRVAGRTLGTEYLRQALSVVDASFITEAGVPDGETNFDPSHVGAWNRLPSLGLGAGASTLPTTAYGGAVASYSEQDREAEVFVDRGSKTLILRPFLHRAMTLMTSIYAYGAGDSLLGASNAYAGPVPPAATPKDGAGLWATTPTPIVGVALPPEYMPRFGRQDIPYNLGGVSGAPFLPGINHLFLDSTTSADPVFALIGGTTNGGVVGVNSILVRTGATGIAYGQFSTFYQGRLFSTSEVISSDLGRGMKGIQLPPYLGIARLYGVYDARDYDAVGSAWASDRVTPAVGGGTNLLRRDANKQTLFILQDGAEDITGETGDHTYIVPSQALDITLSPDYVDGETFEDLEYVVECVVFGFAQNWINGNNYVIARQYDGSGGTVDILGGEEKTPSMVIPCAAPDGDAFYIGYSRTPYQGDPYMTRDGGTRTTSDYQERYGQVPVSDAYLLNAAIQQFDAAGVLIPQTPNRRGLQVLASMDFYTTLGTGKVGGQLYAGTPLDVGRIEDTEASRTRIPSSATAPQWRTLTRAFTEGQVNNLGARASLGVDITTVTGIVGTTLTFTKPDGTEVAYVAGTEFAVGGTTALTADNLVAAINADPDLNTFFEAWNGGTRLVTLTARIPGILGNTLSVATSEWLIIALLPNRPVARGTLHVTKANLSGGEDEPVNAGAGISTLDITGMTERLPLGILLSDSDFLCEDPLRNASSAMDSQPPGLQPVQSILPLAGEDTEYTRFLGGPGHWLALSDGDILAYEAFNDVTSPTGTKKFRLYRGGGAAMVISDPVPGGPVDWASGNLSASLQPVLKGGLLVCKALLVRNFEETAFTVPSTPTHGDEIQLVVLTYGILGCGNTQEEGLNLSGMISPTGYGEGYAASDRYRCEGHPLVVGRTREPSNLDAEPALYPGGTGITTTTC